MRERQWGRIVNIGSVYGVLALNPSLYEAAAGGADTPTKALTNHALVAGRRAASFQNISGLPQGTVAPPW